MAQRREQEPRPHVMEGWGPPLLFKPCCLEPLDSRRPMGCVLKNTEHGVLGAPARPARHTWIFLAFFFFFFLFKLCTASGHVRNPGRGERKY